MIGMLRGKIAEIDLKSFIIDASGVGYIVNSTDEVISKISALGDKNNKEVSIYTHLSVREDSMNIYGFLDKSDLELFELLITVSGIGPKTALGVLNQGGREALKNAIQTEDTSILTKVSGIGKKMAEKIVLELKDKASFGLYVEKNRKRNTDKGDMDRSDDHLDNEFVYMNESVEALTALGYKESDIRDVIKKIYRENSKEKTESPLNTKEIIKRSLKLLSGK